MPYLKLFRIPLLVLIALTQFIVHSQVTCHIVGMDYNMPSLQLFLIIATTVIIAAGGFVINDYYDMRIDEINHPLTRLVGNSISKHETMNIYIVLVVLGFTLSIILGILTRDTFNSFILVSMIGLLWFYSSSYKRQLIVGNLIISVSVAMIPFIVALYESKSIMKWWSEKLTEYSIFITDENLSDVIPYINENYQIIGIFSIFIFILAFTSEIIRNLYEEKGERELECHTIPIVYGHKTAKFTIYAILALVNIICLYSIIDNLQEIEFITVSYYICTILAFSGGLAVLLKNSEKPKDYKTCLTVAQLLLCSVIAYGFVFGYLNPVEWEAPSL